MKIQKKNFGGGGGWRLGSGGGGGGRVRGSGWMGTERSEACVKIKKKKRFFFGGGSGQVGGGGGDRGASGWGVRVDVNGEVNFL